MRGQRKNPRKAVQPFENKKRKIDIFKNYEANGVEKIQRKLEIFSTLISKKSNLAVSFNMGSYESPLTALPLCSEELGLFGSPRLKIEKVNSRTRANGVLTVRTLEKSCRSLINRKDVITVFSLVRTVSI